MCKRVLVLSKNGEELNTITCDGQPAGVAVDDNGHIYVALWTPTACTSSIRMGRS